MAQKQKVAVFDIDGTLFRSSLLIELVEVMVEQGYFDKSVWKKCARSRRQWKDRKISYDDYIMDVVQAYLTNIKGVHYGEFREAGKEVTRRYKDRVYAFTRDLVEKYKSRGYFLLAISHSPKGIVDPFCRTLGFDKTYGMVYEIGPSDRFTGTVIDEHLIQNKGAVLKRAVEKENLTLAGSVAVGDTESDITMLELVDTPICFNPNKRLLTYAKRNGWKVVVERKDAIYTIA